MAERRALRNPGYFGDSEAAHRWRERRDRAIALRDENALSERMKGLVAIVDARRAWTFQSGKVRKAFSGLGSDLAPRLVGRGPQECEAIITQRVLSILRALSGEDAAHSTASKQTDA